MKTFLYTTGGGRVTAVYHQSEGGQTSWDHGLDETVTCSYCVQAGIPEFIGDQA